MMTSRNALKKINPMILENLLVTLSTEAVISNCSKNPL